MSTIEERSVVAMNATCLTDVPHKITQVDLIKARGMSRSNVASHYLRLISKPARQDMERMYAALLFVCQLRNLRGDHHESTTSAIEYLMNPKCGTCNGEGEIERKGQRYTCRKCKGEKLRREPGDRDAQVLIDFVLRCRSSHSFDMWKRLK